MLVQVGRRNASEDVVDLLLECHGRIRRFLIMARNLAEAAGCAPPADVAATAGEIRRYFAEGFRLHVEDEEVDIAPRIARAAAAQLVAEHHGHLRDLTELLALCAELERQPEQLPAVAAALRATVGRLTVQLEAHLEFEERMIFPAIRALHRDQRDAIREAMRLRRERKLRAAGDRNRA